jgi:A/G-specific adenine glycosylase
LKRPSASAKRDKAETEVAPLPPAPLQGEEKCAAALLAWYDRHARVLPWRVAPGDRAQGVVPDPYRVWLSEVMLQQTTVAAVKPYFDRFLAAWPTVTALAKAPRDEVMKAWAGLGYYARARNLKACAEVVARDLGGQFPETLEGLKALPGIGDYTAAAIAAIAFDVPAAVVDGNIERVIARLDAIETPLPAAKAEIRRRQAELTPEHRAGDYAQAMMDLGAAICTPKRPACVLCPLASDCVARQQGRQEEFPRRAVKAERPTRYGFAYVAQRADGAVLLRRRADAGLLGGMSEVPGSQWSEAPEGEPQPPFPAAWQKAPATVVHVFTHFRLELTVFGAAVVGEHPGVDDGWWSPPAALPGEALPSVMRKAIEAAFPGATKRNRSAA